MFLQKSSNSPVFGSTEVEKVATPALVQSLKVLLADVFTFYLRAHGFHWNVTGQDFTQFHDLFGDISDDSFGSIDPIAENLRKLNQTAPASFMEFLQLRTLGEASNSTEPSAMASNLAAANEQVLVTLNKAFNAANGSDEQGIANFLAERIDMHQKWGWQLRMSSGMSKAAEMKTENGTQFPAAAFAYVPDATSPSTWKLRLWETPDQKETRHQVGMAVAALGEGFRGNKVEIPSGDLAGVKAKVRAAWKKVNETDAEVPAVIA